MQVAPREMNLEDVLTHWRIFGAGPREGRALDPNRQLPPQSVVLNTEEELERFVRKHVADYMVCISTQHTKKTFAKKPDIPKVTTLFFDVDDKKKRSGRGAQLLEHVQTRADAFCDKHGFKRWVLAVTDHGVHLYARIPAIHPINDKRLPHKLDDNGNERDGRYTFEQLYAFFYTTILRKALDVEKVEAKMDSAVVDIARVVKLTGTAKPGGEPSYFATEKPQLEEDAKLLEYMLNLRPELPAAAAEAAEITKDGPSPEVLAVVSASSYLQQLLKHMRREDTDRSADQFQIVKGLHLRGVTSPKEIAKFLVTLPGSKAREVGYNRTLTDVTRIITSKITAKEEEKEAQESSLDEWAPTLKAFLAMDIPPIEWLVPGLLGRGLNSILAGAPKTYKSFIALYMALHAAERKHKVMYLAGEGHAANWQERLKRVVKAHGLKEAPDTFRFALYSKINCADQRSLAKIRAYIEDHEPALLVIDTLRSQMGGNENDSEIIGQLIANMTWLKSEIPSDIAPGFLFVHHERKSREDGGIASNNIRGSNALAGWVDTIINAKVLLPKRKKSADGKPLPTGRKDVKLNVGHRAAESGLWTCAVDFDPKWTGDNDEITVTFEKGGPVAEDEKDERHLHVVPEPAPESEPPASDSPQERTYPERLFAAKEAFITANVGKVISGRMFALKVHGTTVVAQDFFRDHIATDPRVYRHKGLHRVRGPKVSFKDV